MNERMKEQMNEKTNEQIRLNKGFYLKTKIDNLGVVS